MNDDQFKVSQERALYLGQPLTAPTVMPLVI